MEKNVLRTIFIALFLVISNATSAQWSKVITIDSFKRDREITFVIGDTAYVGTGDTGNFQYMADFRAYTQNSNTWVKARPFPIVGGDDGFSFVINDTAYVGGGANPNYLNEFYAYTPSAGWINMGNAPGGITRVTACGFSIGEKGYAGTGTSYGVQLNDFYEYSPLTNTWTAIASYPHIAGACVAFSVNGKGYVGLGQASNTLYNDMYEYDPSTNKWDTMASVPTPWGWSTASHFVICGKLIIALGDTAAPGGSFTTNQTWMFDPSDGPKGTWTRLQDFPGPLPDYAASGFTMGDTGFIYGGANYPTDFYRAALYRYVPLVVTVTPSDTSVCYGAQVKLSASGGTSYLWSNSDTTSSITVLPTNTTTYFVTATGAVCNNKDSVIVQVKTVQALTPQTPTECLGTTVLLSVDSTGTNYVWTPSSGLSATTGDSVIAAPSITTTYVVSGKDSLGCAVTDTDVVYISPVPDTPTITHHGNFLISSATQGNQWLRNDSVLQGATNQTYLITLSGVYKVITQNPANGCSSTSDTSYYTPTGINQLTVESGQLTVYPNPTGGEINVNISLSAMDVKDWNLQIIDVLGRTVYTKSPLNPLKGTFEIDISNLPGGVYFICVINKTGREVVPVVKQN